MFYERPMLYKAISDPDNWAIRMEYEDAKGVRTIRHVSPMWSDGESFTGLCLTKGEPRTFILSRCSDMKLVPAHEIVIEPDV